MPAVDVFEEPESIRIVVEVPGVKPEVEKARPRQIAVEVTSK